MTPTPCPPLPDLMQAQMDLDAETASDEQLEEAIHLLANYLLPLRLQLDMLRAEFIRRQRAKSKGTE